MLNGLTRQGTFSACNVALVVLNYILHCFCKAKWNKYNNFMLPSRLSFPCIYLLSFSSVFFESFQTDPLLFQPLCMLMSFFLSPCFGFLFEMSASADLTWQPSLFFFVLFLKPKPGLAAGGHSRIKITMSHPCDLSMCQRVQS